MQNSDTLDGDTMSNNGPTCPPTVPFPFLTTHSDFGKLCRYHLPPLSLSHSEIASSSSLRRDANFASLSYEQTWAHFREVS